MTEHVWHTATDPTLMLQLLEGKASPRKLRLFAVACARLALDRSAPVSTSRAVETAERFADASADARDLNQARSLACAAAQKSVRHGSRYRLDHPARVREFWQFFAADTALPDHNMEVFVTANLPRNMVRLDPGIKAPIPVLLRCVFSYPERPATFYPDWKTSSVLALATTMYESNDFTAAPVLADALQDGGCEAEDILAHLRGPGPHVRGCWVCDLVLGRG